MRFGFLFALCLIVGAKTSSAETLNCTISVIRGIETSAFLADSYQFSINSEDGSAVVVDAVSQRFNGRVEVADLVEYSDKRVTLTWELEGAKMSDASSNLNFRATWLRARNELVVRVKPFRSRFNGTAEGRGSCSVTE